MLGRRTDKGLPKAELPLPGASTQNVTLPHSCGLREPAAGRPGAIYATGSCSWLQQYLEPVKPCLHQGVRSCPHRGCRDVVILQAGLDRGRVRGQRVLKNVYRSISICCRHVVILQAGSRGREQCRVPNGVRAAWQWEGPAPHARREASQGLPQGCCTYMMPRVQAPLTLLGPASPSHSSRMLTHLCKHGELVLYRWVVKQAALQCITARHRVPPPAEPAGGWSWRATEHAQAFAGNDELQTMSRAHTRA